MVAVPPSIAADNAPSKNLKQLAAQARKSGELAPLRRFARSTTKAESRGQAYLILGYRAYAKRDFTGAAADFHRASQAGFSLADIACYYWAVSAREEGKSEEIVEALEGYRSRFPASPLRLEATEVLAEALLNLARPEPAIQVLTAEPRVRRQPELSILLAQAYRDSGKPLDAARAYQEVYYAFPVTAESREALENLERLREELGGRFPQPSDEVQTARAERLLNLSLPAAALADYEKLLQERASSPFAPRWQIGRARSLIRLRRRDEAITLLQPALAENPELDAQRLYALIDAFLLKDDDPAALILLNQMRTVYPHAASYASALRRLGGYFVRKGDWKTAAEYYQTLRSEFPQSPSAREADWRLAWNLFLEGQSEAAARALAGHITRFPDSPNIPAALYWLGRIAEHSGADGEAKRFYGSVRERFVQSYYAFRSGDRIRGLASKSGAGKETSPSVAVFPVSFVSLNITPRDDPAVRKCRLLEPSDSLQPFQIMSDLGLDEIAEDYLIAQLSDQPNSPELLLALSLSRAAQDKASAALLNARRAVPRATDYAFSDLPRELWNLLYPKDYWGYVQRQARLNGVDPYVVMGLIRQESAFNPRAVSVADARGLMQILPSTVSRTRRGRLRAAQRLFNPAYNIQFGCRHLRSVLRIFNGSLEHALAAYNAGDSRVRNWISQREFRDNVEFLESIPIPATRGYVEAVLRDAAIYRQLLTGTAKFAKCPQVDRN